MFFLEHGRSNRFNPCPVDLSFLSRWCALVCSFQRAGPVILGLLAGVNLLHLKQIWVGSDPLRMSHSSFLCPSMGGVPA